MSIQIILVFRIAIADDQELYKQQLFSLLSEMRKAFDVDDSDDVDVDNASDDTSALGERLRQRRPEGERVAVRRTDVDWSSFNAYVDEIVAHEPPLANQRVEEI